MPLITWTEELSVHVPELDNHHQTLVKLINELFDAIAQLRGEDVLAKILGELIEYMGYHFAAEETMMAAYNYPDLRKHKFEHKKLTEKVLDFWEQFNNGRVFVDFLLMDFLADWLKIHILNTDKKYSPFMNIKGKISLTTKSDLIYAVSQRTGLLKGDIQKIIETFITTIKSTVGKGEKVTIKDFGTFARSQRKAREGKNPQTGETILIPSAEVPKFAPGKAFRVLANTREIEKPGKNGKVKGLNGKNK